MICLQKFEYKAKIEEKFKVDMGVAKKSKASITMPEDLGIEANEEEDNMEILPYVNSMILKKVIDWCIYHREDRESLEEDLER